MHAHTYTQNNTSCRYSGFDASCKFISQADSCHWAFWFYIKELCLSHTKYSLVPFRTSANSTHRSIDEIGKGPWDQHPPPPPSSRCGQCFQLSLRVVVMLPCQICFKGLCIWFRDSWKFEMAEGQERLLGWVHRSQMCWLVDTAKERDSRIQGDVDCNPVWGHVPSPTFFSLEAVLSLLVEFWYPHSK